MYCYIDILYHVSYKLFAIPCHEIVRNYYCMRCFMPLSCFYFRLEAMFYKDYFFIARVQKITITKQIVFSVSVENIL